MAPQIRAKGLRFSYASDPGLSVYANREKLRQILLNLVSNAVKFTPEGGHISVDCECTDDTVRIRVRDNGVGIPAERLKVIFDPFVQVGRSLSTEHGGTGLGLAISRDLARLLGGDLRFESVVGRGTTFVLTLPTGPSDRL